MTAQDVAMPAPGVINEPAQTAVLAVTSNDLVQPVQRAFEAIPKQLGEAAAVSGLSSWQTFWRIEFPLAWPGVLSAMVLTFVHTLGEFGVVLMIGGSIPGETKTIAIAIYDRVQAAVARQRPAQVALRDADRVRRRAAVEDARDQPLPAQALRGARADLLALLDLQTDPFSGHDRRMSVAVVATG